MFFHGATRKTRATCQTSTFLEDLNFLNPRSHLKIHGIKRAHMNFLDVL